MSISAAIARDNSWDAGTRLLAISGDQRGDLIEITAVGVEKVLARLLEVRGPGIESMFGERAYELVDSLWTRVDGHSWNQVICEVCWNAKNPDRPAELPGPTEEPCILCARCARPTGSGIFLRADPSTVLVPRSRDTD